MDKWGASDLFVTAGKVPAVRLHGSVVPLEVPATPSNELERFFEHVLGEEQRTRFRKTGSLELGYGLPDGRRFRLTFARQLNEICMVARALKTGDLSLAQLGLPDTLARMCERSRGLVLVSGPSGAGKSTSMATMVHHINQMRPVHIVTIEEPVEYRHRDLKARVTQREVGVDVDSFEVALRQAMRESPDVILVGELRTAEAVRVALSAAMTGHLVLATLNTVDVTGTVRRILSMFPEHQTRSVALDLSLSLVGLASQRLLARADGRGRVPAVERLLVTPAAAHLIREQREADLAELIRTSRDDSTVGYDRALAELYHKQAITAEVALGNATNPDELTLRLRGMSSGVMTIQAAEYERPTARVDMQTLLNAVQEQQASDLHLSVGRPPMLRLCGQLQAMELPVLSGADVKTLVHSVMSARQRSAYELERELDFSLGLADGRRFRVNTYFERGHMAAALRAIQSNIPDAASLGLPEAVLRLSQQPHGLLLVVGPTGAGKTTTLACLIDQINHTRPAHVITIEDPIEYVHTSDVATIHQREVHSDTHGFNAALRYILRQDPDVVLIGELRDQETIAAALTAAETGHLVLATLHTNDAVQSIDRIIDVFPAHQQSQARSQLAAALLGVVSQRLLPRADGGGRVAAFEVMLATAAIRTLIRDNKMHQAVAAIQTSQSKGMITLDAALERLARQGVVSAEEAMRYMLNPAILQPNASG